MTWHTQNGDRFLIGKEAELFVLSVRMALEAMEDDTLLTYETVLKKAPRSYLVRLFAYVAKALLTHTESMPELNAWTEGAVGIFHREFAVSLEAELEDDDPTDSERYRLRQLLIDATESELEEEDRVSLESKDVHEWQALLALHGDSILWDLDWEMSHLFPASTPGGYFATFDPPVTYIEALCLLERLCGYTQSPVRLFDPERN